ncbi:STAS domain-containing protein [Actinomadura sp. 9N407]|uniref:STAS domain-containing protein n=1 Tax=Actinomadura sp. 9N407 TaxID=3375154 RepID=UPI00378F90C3
MMTDDGRTARRRARRVPDLRCRAGAPRPAREAGHDGTGVPPFADGGFEIEVVRTEGDAAVAAACGEIDVRTADILRGRLMELHAAGHRHLVVDFSDVAFCDAAGLGALVAVQNRLGADGGGVRLAGARPAQRKLLRITGLHRVFGLYDDVEGALAATAPSTR